MNILSVKKILVFLLVFCFSAASGEAQSFDRPQAPRQQKSVSKKPIKRKKERIVGPKAAVKAQKKQADKDKKRRKDSEKAVKEFRNHALEIQSPEVRERIRQNRKNADASYKAKRKQNTSRAKKAARKYR